MADVIEGKRILITGGAGFIGSTLLGRLVDRNEIVVLDNLRRNALKSSPHANHGNITMVEGDILDIDTVRKAARGVDVVVHAAAIAGIDTVIASPVTTLRVNMLGSANVLQAASELDSCDRVVCISTSEVFGGRAFQAHENDNADIGPVGEPRWTYAVSKLAEEHLAVAYFQEQFLPTVVLRPFNVYGPGQVGEGAMRNFLQRALADEPLLIYGDGSQIRAWCYVDDMVEGMLAALAHPNAVGESFNIGNSRAVSTTLGLAETIVRATGSRSEIHMVPRQSADIAVRIPNVSKALDMIGFEAKVGLYEGLERTAAYLRAR
ncbi:MAG: NAD-dependent epimerase/dehydratase family protein [Micrococcales bacterium]|nr:NAD-dependent epimerase/dehydratase family protein [Micrococcales bacterium]